MKRKFINALKACAKAHNMKSHHYASDQEFAIEGDNMPTYADVCSIVRAFTGINCVRQTMGMIIVELWQADVLPEDEVDWMSVEFALPYGTKL